MTTSPQTPNTETDMKLWTILPLLLAGGLAWPLSWSGAEDSAAAVANEPDAAAAAPAEGAGDDPPKPDETEDSTEDPEDDSHRELFDGKTLTHWKPAKLAGGGDILVEDGALIIEPGQPMSGVVWSGPELPKCNYEVTFEAQRVEGSDFFVGLTFPVNEAPCTLILGGWGGGLTGFSSIDGMDASENNTTGFQRFTNGEWRRIRMQVNDARVDAWIDDKKVAGFDHRGHKLSVRIEVEPCRPFGFSTYNTKSAIRKLSLRELTDEERLAAVQAADERLKEQ